jgi:hypothetical protein
MNIFPSCWAWRWRQLQPRRSGRTRAVSPLRARAPPPIHTQGKSVAPTSGDSKDDFTPRRKAQSDAFSKGKSATPASVDSDDEFTPRIKAKSDAFSKGRVLHRQALTWTMTSCRARRQYCFTGEGQEEGRVVFVSFVTCCILIVLTDVVSSFQLYFDCFS